MHEKQKIHLPPYVNKHINIKHKEAYIEEMDCGLLAH
jgi:hypothetical protein